MVLAADGFCHKEEGNECWVEEGLQKIFPLPDRPVAIAHHGQNIIQGRDIRCIVTDFAKAHEDDLGHMTIEDIASTLERDVDPDAQKEVVKQHGKEAIGFWVAGFGAEQGTPEVYEIWWEQCGRAACTDEMRSPLEGGTASALFVGKMARRWMGAQGYVASGNMWTIFITGP